MLSRRGVSDRRGATTVLFAIALVPLLMIVGLAIDYGFYNEAQAQLDMAADSSAISAARIAAAGWQVSPGSNYIQQGKVAGQQWFYAQLGNLPQAKTLNPPRVDVSYNAKLRQVTAKVSYDGLIGTHFGGIFPVHWTYWPNLGIAGSATAVISIASYVEVLMMLDNSSSMLIAADQPSILAMQELTPCSQQGLLEGQPFDYNYSWAYKQTGGAWVTNPPASAYSTTSAPNSNIKIPYGYGLFFYPDATGATQQVLDITPPRGKIGQCDQNFNGPGAECRYPTAFLGKSVSKTGTCTNGYGGPGSLVAYPGTDIPAGATPPGNMPQAPCAFACHNQPIGANGFSNDYYGLALQNQSRVTLRYQVLQNAAADVISAMQNATTGSQLSVGVYQFNAPGTAASEPTGFLKVYPTTTPEASNDWATAESLTRTVAPPQTNDQPDTNFENGMALLSANVKAAGVGATAATALKNLFIVTDGMDDYYDANGIRVQGQISAESCNHFKLPVAQGGLGYTIYVLYTKYYPLPNPYYLQNDKVSAESTGGGPSPIEVAMKACASAPKDFYEADDAADIKTSLSAMLSAALGTAGRLSD